MHVFIVNGKPRSGKDTFCEIMLSINGPSATLIHSTIDKHKKILKEQFGWDGEKTPEMRKALSDLKDFDTKYFDGPFKEMQKLIDINKFAEEYPEYIIEEYYYPYSIIMFHIREPDEIDRVVTYCKKSDVPVTTVLLTRDMHREITNHADSDCEKYEYDVYCNNNGTVDDLKKNVIDIFSYYFAKKEQK